MNPQANLRRAPSRGRRLVKAATKAAIAGLLLALLLLGALNIRGYLLRQRIEKAMATALELRLKHAPDDEIQRRLTALDKDIRKTCKDDRCEYAMEMFSRRFPFSVASRVFADDISWPYRLLGHVGLHEVYFRLTVITRSGLYSAAHSDLLVGPWPTLAASISDSCHYPEGIARYGGVEKHPGWFVSRPSFDTLGGGSAAHLCITDQAQPKEIQAARHINFYCLTRWGNCDQMEEFFLQLTI